MKLFGYLFRVVRAEGFLRGMARIASRVSMKLKSLLFSRLFGAANINFGSGCQFFGTKYISFGRDMSIHRDLWLEAVTEYGGMIFNPRIIFGDRVKMSCSVHITSINKITIGNDVLLGSNVYISDHNHGGYSGNSQSLPSEAPAERRLVSGGEVIIEDNVWIGDNVNIVGPVRVGRGAVIAANTVVRKDIPPGTIVAGAPAKIIKVFDEVTKKWLKWQPNSE